MTFRGNKLKEAALITIIWIVTQHQREKAREMRREEGGRQREIEKQWRERERERGRKRPQ